MTEHPCAEATANEKCVVCFPQARFVFPQDEPNGFLSDKFQRQGGLELRDYFAAKAMNTLTSFWTLHETEITAAKIAEMSFTIADAMMAARQQPIGAEGEAI